MIRDIDWNRKSPMDIGEFGEFFDTHRLKVLQDLVVHYKMIGDTYLKNIEESTVKTKT